MKVLLSQSRGFRAGASAREVLADGVIDTLRTLGEVEINSVGPAGED